MALCLFASALLTGCRANHFFNRGISDPVRPVVTLMSLTDEQNADFEASVLRQFAARHDFDLRYIPAFDADNDRLTLYKQLLGDHSPEPDILEIDIIWPQMLADDLVDLKPYLGADVEAFPSELRKAFTIRGRMVAIPLFMDTGLLYYRSDLLQKYGFRAPPKTWDELEHMASVIQLGERRSGKKNFWGYVWQGGRAEGLTCNALEWQASEGGGRILDSDGAVHVYNPRVLRALQRAASWVGTISPPGVIAYDEDDGLNVWSAGNAAFMRNWLYVYGSIRDSKLPIARHFGVAMLPGGPGGQIRALGGVAIAVSKYSAHREQAIAAIRYLTSTAVQRVRAEQAGSVPTRWALQQDPEIMRKTPFHGALTGQVMAGVIARPSFIAGNAYDEVSRAYLASVHRTLTHERTPEQALLELEAELVRITGSKAVRD